MAEFNTAAAANNLTESQILATYKLKAFIPAYRTIRTDIIRDVPIDESIIKEAIVSQKKVVEVKRINRVSRINGET